LYFAKTELPLDTVEFLAAEADDNDVGAFMDKHAAVEEDDESDLQEDTKRMHADVTAVATGEDAAEDVGEVESVGASAPVGFVPEGGRIISESRLKLVPKVPHSLPSAFCARVYTL